VRNCFDVDAKNRHINAAAASGIERGSEGYTRRESSIDWERLTIPDALSFSY
jgi:hypothetical protein